MAVELTARAGSECDCHPVTVSGMRTVSTAPGSDLPLVGKMTAPRVIKEPSMICHSV